jgi:predicted transcriptional regulator
MAFFKRTTTMVQSVLEMAKDLVMAQIQAGALPPEDMQQTLQHTYASLMALKTMEDTGGVSPVQVSDAAPEIMHWKQSITKYAITCLECGATFKQLSVRHLKDHDLDARAYRAKYGIPRTQPLSAKDTTALRKKIVQQSRPWEKAPTYLKAHAAKAKTTAPATQRRTQRRTSKRATAST